MVWGVGVLANAAGECGQWDGRGKLPVGVTNFNNPYGSFVIRPFPRSAGGVQEIECDGAALGQAVSKLKQGEIAHLQDVSGEQFDLRAGFGLAAEIPVDVGVRDGASTGPGGKKHPKWPGMCRCVRAWWSRFGPECAAPRASTPTLGMPAWAFRWSLGLFSRIPSLCWSPASLGLRTCYSLSSLVNADTAGNPLWGGSFLNLSQRGMRPAA